MPARSARRQKLSELGEFALIDRIRAMAGRPASVVKGIGDDAAVIRYTGDRHLLLTADMLVEGVHFTRKMPPAAVGHKALAASLSDIAAMGGTPKEALISLGAPASCPWDYIASVYKGIKKTAGTFKVALAGGDTVRSGKIVINVSMTGTVKKNNVVYRGGARRGDQVFVTGRLGRSLKSGWHLKFVPRLAQSQHLVKHFKPTAMIDISDGLAADLGHILRESRAGAVLDKKSIPRRKGARLKDALYDGEDFELLFTLPPQTARRLLNGRGGRGFFRIGEITSASGGLRLKAADGTTKKIKPKGFTHF